MTTNAYDSLDLLPDPTVVVRGDGEIVFANRIAARLLGSAPEALAGQDAEAVLPLVDESGNDWWRTCPLQADARLTPRIPETELHLATAGERRPVVLTGARKAGPGGEVELLVLSLRRGERRRRLDAARSDLVSTVSHELRSPLTSVKGFTRTLLAKWERFTDEQKRAMLETVNEDADRVTRLLTELLDVSRIDAGRLQLRRQMVDAADIIARVVDRANANGHDATVRADVGDTPKLYADPDKLEQVLTNLVENGVKYGGGVVSVSCAVEENEVRFTVHDDGPGIEPDHLSRIFTKFFRRPGERRSGTGLGLYITRGIVQAHGGRMWAESEVGSGSSFHFTLPRGGLELAGVQLPSLRASTPNEDAT